MNIFIGFDLGQTGREEEALAAWAEFSAAVTLPFPVEDTSALTCPERISGIAATSFVEPDHPEFLGGEEAYGQIVLSDRFSRIPQGSDERILTLLHESMHLASFSTYLREVNAGKWALVQRHRGAALSWEAHTLASQLFETDAELRLKAEYPDWARRRADYYLALQRASTAAASWREAPEVIRTLMLVGLSLRLELAAVLHRDTPSHGLVSELTQQVATELEGSLTAQDGKLRATADRLRRLLSPLHQDFSTLGTWGAPAYQEAMEAVIQLDL